MSAATSSRSSATSSTPPSSWCATEMRERVKARAHEAAEDRVIDALAGEGARDQTREMFRRKLRAGELDDKEIELEVADTSSPFPMMEIPGQPGMGMGGDEPRRHLRQGLRRAARSASA